jgi:3-oxoacyl-[acyl-carrier protein] reductase
MDLNLKGKKAVVGGGSSGLGYACALELASEGADVAIVARNEERLSESVEKIRAATGRNIIGIKADLACSDGVEKMFAEAVESFKGIDIYVHNTGGPAPGGPLEHEDEAWQHAFELLLMSAIRAYRLILPVMEKNGFGRIINIASYSVREPIAELALSNIFRLGMCSLSKTISQKYAAKNVFINSVCPGTFRTERLEQLVEAWAKRDGISFDESYNRLVAPIPTGKVGEPADLARTVTFLASDKCPLTGCIIPLDGGMLKGLY